MKYIDYELITEQQKEAAKSKYSDELTEKDNLNQDDDKEIDYDLIAAHIHITENMLDDIQNADAENSYYLKKLKDYQNLWQGMDQLVEELTTTF